MALQPTRNCVPPLPASRLNKLLSSRLNVHYPNEATSALGRMPPADQAAVERPEYEWTGH